MKKKLFSLALGAVAAVVATTGMACSNDNKVKEEIEFPAYDGIEHVDYSDVTIPEDFKLGLICLHDEQSTYDKNFIDAAKRAINELGLSVEKNLVMKTNIPESSECETAAKDLASQGCNVIFADSFGHEGHIVNAAKAFPNVEFCHATGVTAKADNAELANFHNAFASIYEGRYIAGVAAGLKLNEMIANGDFAASEAKIGYVGAYTYAEVVSGYTSFYLGAKSVCPTVTMEVQFTGSWFDIVAEKSAAELLIGKGCKLISQHADSMGAPKACEEAGVPNVSYNGSTYNECPETFIISSKIDWTPYFKYIVAQAAKGEAIAKDWCGTLKTGSVALTNIGGAAAEGTLAKLTQVRKDLAEGKIKVFDINNFTVGGNKKDSVTVNSIEVIKNGVFVESDVELYRSAPYFELRIDGITLLNEKY